MDRFYRLDFRRFLESGLSYNGDKRLDISPRTGSRCPRSDLFALRILLLRAPKFLPSSPARSLFTGYLDILEMSKEQHEELLGVLLRIFLALADLCRSLQAFHEFIGHVNTMVKKMDVLENTSKENSK